MPTGIKLSQIEEEQASDPELVHLLKGTTSCQKISVWPAFLCARNLFIYFDYFDFASGLGPSTNFYADDVHDL